MTNRTDDKGEEIDEKWVEDQAWRILQEEARMGDTGAETPPPEQKCERDDCGEDAVMGPGDMWLCREHQKEHFRERHG
ncbi:hypothetical protein [Halosimplex halobium]|uniref:hypothetical protein n=1 Tax=Halosimplex halobium TaxID=3396618 RepID=UPI003F549458